MLHLNRHEKPIKNSLRSFIVQECFLNSWWLIVVLLLTYCCFHHIQERQSTHSWNLQKKLNFLLIAKNQTLMLNNDFQMQLNSHKDPAWIEMVLKKELGLVPEGEIKVHFTHHD